MQIWDAKLQTGTAQAFNNKLYTNLILWNDSNTRRTIVINLRNHSVETTLTLSVTHYVITAVRVIIVLIPTPHIAPSRCLSLSHAFLSLTRAPSHASTKATPPKTTLLRITSQS